MQTDLNGMRIVITGITGGIAMASANRLAAQGAELVVSARSEEQLEQALAEINGKVSGYVMDLQDESSVKNFFASAGEIDHLVTPAASSMCAPIAEMTVSAARNLLETKQWGQMLCVHHALPYLSKSGSITLFSGTVTQKPLPGATMFAAVGAASEAAGRIWAYELAPIRVNTVVPGVIETDIWSSLYGGDEIAKEQLEGIASILPVGQVGSSDDVAKAVSFLIDNVFVNGISLVVDGGHRLI
jgi:NAD(P)-dependent dehydrogenase (short-subunit alcohol dehydrogenase family)